MALKAEKLDRDGEEILEVTGQDPPANGSGASEASPVSQETGADELPPKEIVRRLDEYIIGQHAAKRAVAIALRNRVRRQRLPEEMRGEVLPKNILMIGPTGVGKTEIARRLARLTRSPFIKVEATKFTEVGYVGRDVESIVRDLLEQTITEVHNERIGEVEENAKQLAEARILETMLAAEESGGAGQKAEPSAGDGHHDSGTDGRVASDASQAVAASSGPSDGVSADGEAGPAPAERPRVAVAQPSRSGQPALPQQSRSASRRRKRLARKLAERQLEDRYIEIEIEEPVQPPFEGFVGTGLEEMGVSLSDFFSQLAPPRKRIKRMTVADARSTLVQEETDRLIDMDRVYDDAIRLVEDSGIIFIDEVDKICGPASDHGPDVSGEGVQRDLLPILEGSTVHTRYGSVRTDHILFVAAGAFNVARPSDLIPEFQGRFPIRVELKALDEADLARILTEPSNALTKQYAALLQTENVVVEFSDDGVRELAYQAFRVNDEDENIGARRLFTVMEKVLEDLAFKAEEYAGQTVRIDADYVRAGIGDLVRNDDIRKYVL
ncbi:MAG TPA: ATP-dependent protease ATPase subunit HslU [Candidatus Sulfotelmatobacter sp.]|nr:ATP-dependent protease ATPase subunit HslU [Candidatus Sulfotelmatobacter sp.]